MARNKPCSRCWVPMGTVTIVPDPILCRILRGLKAIICWRGED